MQNLSLIGRVLETIPDGRMAGWLDGRLAGWPVGRMASGWTVDNSANSDLSWALAGLSLAILIF